MQIARVLIVSLSCILLAFVLAELYLTRVIVSFVAQPLSYPTLESDLLLTLAISVLLLPLYLLLSVMTNSASTCTVLSLSVTVLLKVLNSKFVRYLISSLPLHEKALERIGTALTLLKPYGALTWLLPLALICTAGLHICALYADIASARIESPSMIKQLISETLKQNFSAVLLTAIIATILILSLGYTQALLT